MARTRFKAVEGKYTILIPFFIAYIPFIIALFLMKDIGNHFIAVGIPFYMLKIIWKSLSYYLFSSYYEFSCQENYFTIKKGNAMLQEIPLQDIHKISFSYNPEFQASVFTLSASHYKLFLATGFMATSKKDTAKAKQLITETLKPILLENSFQENIIEKKHKIIYEYEKQ
ncbi:hypothetical protein [Streptococcus plurextorum]|uniref:hypothetical protein n=1 Tax=Streptococcus plurextorum TaxID=456876 RepID=UPI0003F6DB1A|nr:hypothetical protein [Streptococcus plurextorum]